MTSEKDELMAMVHHFNLIRPFNKLLGLTPQSMDIENGCVRFAMREELKGNTVSGALHGGVISSVLDIAGGFVVFLDLYRRMREQPMEKLMERFTKISTIDLRTDYLRPGIGKSFVASGFTLRTGNKVAVVRSELRNDEGVLIAVGTASYIVG